MPSFPLPPGYPVESDFQPNQIVSESFSWEFHRNPGRGGQNYGENKDASNGSVIVALEYNVESDHNTVRNPDYHWEMTAHGVVNAPEAWHVGHRLDTGNNPVGPGATFKGSGTMKVVALKDWLLVAITQRTW